MKKVLFIAPSPLYLEKGSSLRMYSILEKLAKHYKIDLVTYSLGRKFKIKNVNIHRTPLWFKPKLPVGKPTFSKILLDFFMWIKTIKLSLFNKYEIIHCEDFEGIGIGYFTSLLNRNSKYVYDLHNRILDNLHLNSKPKKIRDSLLLFLEKLFVKKSDKIILNWRIYEKDPIFSNKKKFLFYDELNTLCKKIDFPKGKYLIYTGNFEKYQGVEEFLKSFKEIGNKIKIVLVGEPTEKLKYFIKKNGLTKKIMLIGKKKIEETNFLIKKALFAILPRIKGVQPSMKLIHYLVLDKPILAKNISCNKELLIEDKNSLFYSSKKELEKKLKLLISDKRLLSMLKKGAKRTKKEILRIWDNRRFIKEYEK